jgi:hypothetical protein
VRSAITLSIGARRAGREIDAIWADDGDCRPTLLTCRTRIRPGCSSTPTAGPSPSATEPSHNCALDDEGYRWDLAWLPRTQEVAAFCVGWSNERAHIHTSAEGVIQLSATPGLVRVLGTAFSSEEATRRIAGHLAIDEIRSLFAT